MPCYNSAAYLDEAIRSILCQTMDNLELIIVDDCSRDDSLVIARSYQVKDQRLSVITLEKNSGAAVARNTGLRVARGDWLGILDSDDIAMPQRFEEQLRVADHEKEVVLIGSNSETIDKIGNRIKMHKYPTAPKALVRRLVTIGAFPPHSSMLYRADVVKGVAGFNRRYTVAEDYDLWLRLSALGKIASVDNLLVKIRKHKRNISNSGQGMLQHKYAMAACTCHYLRQHNSPDPSTTEDETTWQEFLTWVEKRMTEEYVFQKRKAWADARELYFGAGSRIAGGVLCGMSLIQSWHLFSLLWEKHFGSSLPQMLAQEWISGSRGTLQ